MKYQILLKNNYQFNETTTRLFLKTISNFQRGFLEKVKYPFPNEFIIDCDSKEMISFYFTYYGKGDIKNSLTALFQDGAEIFLLGEEVAEENYKTINTLYSPSKFEDKKLVTYSNEKVFQYMLAKLQPNTRIRIQFEVTKERPKTDSPYSKDTMEAIIEALITVEGKTKYERSSAYEISHNISDLTAGNRKLYVKIRNAFTPIRLTTSEFLNLFQFPTLNRKDDELSNRIYKLMSGQRTLRKEEFSSGVRVGNLFHPRVENRDVYLDLEKLREHFFVSGKTGSGKSSFIEEFIHDLLHKKVKSKSSTPGFIFFDPAETSVLGVIDYIRKLEADGEDISDLIKLVHYIDLSPTSKVDVTFPINLLYKDTDTTKLMDFVKELFGGDSQTPRLDRILMTSMKALLLDSQDHTIVDIKKLLKNDSYRKDVCERLKKNPYAYDEYQFFSGEPLKPNEIEPVLNRLDPFINTTKKQRMFGTTQHGLKDIRKWMDEGHIILVNMAGMSDYDRKLIVGYMATQYYQVALQRPQYSMIHFMILDESHKTQFGILSDISFECRKYGLALGLLTQYMEQYNPDYLKSISQNFGTFASFKQGDSGAKQLESVLNRRVDRSSLMALNKFIGIVSTEDCGEDKSVMIQVAPPYRYTNGKIVDYHSPKAIEANMNDNRNFAYKLMARDYLKNKIIDSMIFKSQEEYEVMYEEDGH